MKWSDIHNQYHILDCIAIVRR